MRSTTGEMFMKIAGGRPRRMNGIATANAEVWKNLRHFPGPPSRHSESNRREPRYGSGTRIDEWSWFIQDAMFLHQVNHIEDDRNKPTTPDVSDIISSPCDAAYDWNRILPSVTVLQHPVLQHPGADRLRAVEQTDGESAFPPSRPCSATRRVAFHQSKRTLRGPRPEQLALAAGLPMIFHVNSSETQGIQGRA